MAPTFRRRRLARRLRQMREQAGLTLVEAALRLDKTRSSLGRIETGQSRADVHLARSMMDFYDVYDPESLDLVREANRPGWWTKYGIDDRGYISMETDASSLHELAIVNIPGLLQTEVYMRALFAAHRRPADRVEAEVSARLFRQRRLVDEEFPLELVAIIDEAALRKRVGGAEVMRGQLRRLAERAELPTVNLQVLPDAAGSHAGTDGAYAILGFPEGDPSLLFVAYVVGAVHIEKPEEVAQARLKFDQLRSEALSPHDSLALIERLAGEL
ncbi:MAG: Scr1 family TA system antitoxin-like transcriptional regulator [Actinophytocola sp.]|uniref:Scr1 family TA system antitoxin-like transcriptional regulator n=1 Tax=Actinophytocola sp. TaxID=1872138 RepID=UPI003C733DF5